MFLALSFFAFYTNRKNRSLNKQLELIAEVKTLKDNHQKLYEEMCKKEQEARKELDQKTKQSQQLMAMLHKARMEAAAEDIVIAIRQSADGHHVLAPEEWQQLFAAVDALYPQFRNMLTSNIGRFSEQQMKVCYLMCIGLSNPQINNVTGLPRTTIWRWTRSYSWITRLSVALS